MLALAKWTLIKKLIEIEKHKVIILDAVMEV